MVTETPSVSWSGTASWTTKSGGKVTIKQNNVTINSVTKRSSCTATKAYVYTDGGSSTLGVQVGVTATFSGDTATFGTPVSVSNSTSYYIVCDKAGSSYTLEYGNISLPHSGTNLNFINGHIDGQSDGASNFSNIVSCETNTVTDVTYNATAFSLSFTQKTPLYFLSKSVNALALSLTLNSFSSAVANMNYSSPAGTRGTEAIRKDRWGKTPTSFKSFGEKLYYQV